jgi:hypothetical protein
MKFTARFWQQVSIGLVALLSSPATLLASPARAPLADGIYLYGQSSKPEQIGSEYLIFQVREGKMAGAIFLPRSEFSCFTGRVTPQQLDLSIVDPYDREAYRHSIALKPLDPVASGRPIMQNTSLEGYYPIATIGEDDRRLLQTCLNQSRD